MRAEEVAKRLKKQGYKPRRYRLEPFELLIEDAPEGALDDLDCYRLVEKGHKPARDAPYGPWLPVIVIDLDVLVGPSPDLLARALSTAGYWERPEAFTEEILDQLHEFSLEGFGGWSLTRESSALNDRELVIRGSAYGPDVSLPLAHPFTTTVPSTGAASFEVEDVYRDF